ncbi:rna-directed dna polymerase from mobile element jockey-like [Limosa lapponica baueri]|uniref:Rna-directed dna polymerase from mobile element jockey-like n=1 Tax=Limosa lapponica baueri TaxID=1758121 RepID=A0A2I0TQ23_LIMLA|nr:rna-directed dna polymerase from mobile element jockey-like [Limosa lapponica baueri]
MVRLPIIQFGIDGILLIEKLERKNEFPPLPHIFLGVVILLNCCLRSMAKAPVIQREMVRDLLQCLDIHKSMGLDGILPRVLRELAEVLTESLSIIYQQSWQTGEVPADWRLANMTSIHKKGQQDDPGNYRPVSLTSVPGKVMEQIMLSVIMRHMKDNQAIRPSQRGFMRCRSCLTNLISFYDKVTRLVDEGKAVDVAYLDFSKAFDTVSHNILLEKLAAHGLDGNTLCWGQLLCLMEINHTPSNEAELDIVVPQRNPFISMTARLGVEISIVSEKINGL